MTKLKPLLWSRTGSSSKGERLHVCPYCQDPSESYEDDYTDEFYCALCGYRYKWAESAVVARERKWGDQ